MQVHQFKQSNDEAQQITNDDWTKLYKTIWPNLVEVIEVTDLERQLKGVDRIVVLSSGRRITVDEKIRNEDYGDCLIEAISNMETGKIGWTLDESKITDYVLYYVKPTGKACLLDADQLRRTAKAKLREWTLTKRPKIAFNEGYRTKNYAIDWAELYLAMYKQTHKMTFNF